jgi:hyaluronoglucosaminidase
MNSSPFRVRGVVEGFYGVYYTWPERTDLIQFIGRHGYNLYIYAPKDDWHHRQRWSHPYPVTALRAFAACVAAAQAAGVQFCYALHCSLPPEMSEAQAVTAIAAKLETLYACGVRAFSLLFDDLDLGPSVDPHEQSRRAATLHAAICNDVRAWLQQRDSDCTLSMCPTDYHGSAPFSVYVHTLGALLDPSIATFYTGPQICAPTISAADAAAFAQAVGRAPLLWDNYPVNDLDMQSELHLGPIRGRAADLAQSVSGIVVNPMLQAEASKIPLLTYAAYLNDPQRYDPETAWRQAALVVAGEDSVAALDHLAGYTRSSCLDRGAPAEVAGLVRAVIASWRDDQRVASEAARQALAGYFEQLREDCYHLKYHLDNLRLRDNLLPWVLALEAQLALARHAQRVLERRAQHQDEDRARRELARSMAELGPQPKDVAADALIELVRFVQMLEQPLAIHPSAPAHVHHSPPALAAPAAI